MAVSSATLTTLNKVLKEYYLQGLRKQLNDKVLIVSRLNKNSKDLQGLKGIVALHVGRSGGIGARRELEDLPAASAQQYQRLEYVLAYLYGRGQVTGQAESDTRSSLGAYVKALSSEMERLGVDLNHDLSRQYWGTGDGKVETCGVTSSSTTVVLNSDEALKKGFIYKNLRVDIGTVADPTSVASNREVQSVSIAGPSIVIDGAAVTTATTDFIFVAGSNDASGTKEIDAGLQKLIPTAANTVGNLDGSVAANSYWDIERDNVNGELSYDRMIQMRNRVEVAGGNLGSILTTYGLQRKYFNQLQPQARYMEPTKLKGGWEALDFFGKPLIADRHAPYGEMRFVDESQLCVFRTSDWSYIEEGGSALHWVTNKDAMEFAVKMYANLGAFRRNIHGLLYNLTDTGF